MRRLPRSTRLWPRTWSTFATDVCGSWSSSASSPRPSSRGTGTPPPRRHAEHYLALAERLGPRVRVTGRGTPLEEMQRELANLRAAFDHWIADGDGERALRLAAAIGPYWTATSHERDGA